MPFAKGSLSIKLQNYPAANRDAVVTLTNRATGQILERKPFLDGTLMVRDIDPGKWEIVVKHPNVVAPLFTGVVSTLPIPLPTFVPVPIRPDDFRDTPIQDVPDADLGPVQQTVSAARTTAVAVGGKAPGEAIRATDWNQLVNAVSDIAGAVLELTSLVSPRGHDHPEIAARTGRDLRVVETAECAGESLQVGGRVAGRRVEGRCGGGRGHGGAGGGGGRRGRCSTSAGTPARSESDDQ